MSKLIERAENGQVMIAGCGSNCKHEYKYCHNACEDCPTINEIYEKLASYEDIGTAEEFKALKEDAEAYRNEIAEELEGIYAKPCVDVCRVIIRKAIDDFISRLEKHTQENWIDHQEYGITWSDIEKIAEEMKKGVGRNE